MGPVDGIVPAYAAWEQIVIVVFVAANLLLLSVIELFYGWKVFRVFITILTSCAAGVFAWFFISPHLPDKFQFIPPIVLGLTGIAVAIPLQRVASFATTGALGAVIAAAVAVRFFNVPLDVKSIQLIAVASAGFLLAGIPAAIFLRFLVVFTTAGYGALMAIGAAMLLVFTCISKAPVATEEGILASMVAWVGITVIGMVYQYRTMSAPTAPAK